MKQKKSHSLAEDLFALFNGSLFVAFGLVFLKVHGFLTGGTAGLALVITRLSDFSFGQIFFLLNLPFYWLAYRRMGPRFTRNTLISVTTVSLATDYLPLFIRLDYVHPAMAAIMGGLLIGSGMLIMFRHVSSLGGVGILALYLQDKFKISAGYVQMAVDVCIVCVGFFMVSLPVLAYSVLGALTINQLISLNHKPGRYQIT